MNTQTPSHHKETRQVTHNTVREQGSTPRQAASEDNVVTRAQQGHLTLLDWQIANPLQEQSRMPRVRRRRTVDWYKAGMVTLIISAAVAAAELLTHMAG